LEEEDLGIKKVTPVFFFYLRSIINDINDIIIDESYGVDTIIVTSCILYNIVLI